MNYRIIMVIEDDELIRVSMKQIIEDEGYSPTLAGNGEEALAMLEKAEELPALILLDVNMPVMDGLKFSTAKNSDVRLGKIPVVIITADGQAHEKAREANAQGWIRKPIEIGELLKAIQKFCG